MVPKGWSESYLGEVVTYKKGYAFNSSLYAEEGIRIVRISDTTRDSIHSDNPVFIAGGNVEGLEQYSLFENDIILSTVGSRPHLLDSMVGKAVKVPRSAHNSLLNQNLVKLIPKKTKITNEYLFSMLKKKEFIQFISNLVRGNANQVSITLADLFKYKFILPSLPEQKKIAQILSTWDKAISVTEKLLTNSQQQKKALMQQLLTGKKRLLDENGVRFRGEWKWLRAVELFKTISQKNNSEDVELLAVTQDQGVIPRTMLERRVVMPDGSTKGYKLVVPGNFIISLRSFQGGLEYSRYRGLVSPAYTVLTPIKKIVDEFYKQYYKSYDFIGHLAVAVIGIRDGKQISYEDFSFLKLPYPEIEEQQKIADVLSAADAEISMLEKKLSCLKEEKKALMQQLLTGKRRVKVESEETVSA
ncbi:putative restriction-modification DNA specificity domain protein [Escherichia coli]|uniref:restriction endonuclease subunit S n=1 Tax=Escherichia coli TaxID=562 RepID=UPI0006A0265B|nr:restriction endonuclease subunit S [Escherichia coli]CTT19510.1 putative restriction-modification DNA specificity domain protein [Escherichia coli]CTT22824.1 putative restriction-modification DNA specificity domain protein [Escherichia coli]HCN8302010.1 restriction endonuclease subunit S [Escherichia coli]